MSDYVLEQQTPNIRPRSHDNEHLMERTVPQRTWTRGRSANFLPWICLIFIGPYIELSSGSIEVAKDQNTIYHDTGSAEQQHSHPQAPQHPGPNITYHFNNVNHHNEVTSNDVIEATHINRGPFFDVTASKNVTALVGKTAYLNCRVHNLNNKTVSWVRHRDIHLLTTGKHTYTSDLRFQSIHNPQTEDWSLQVRYSQKRDSGIYECQVSTTPPIGHSMYLSIVEPITTLVGGPDMYINTGSTVNLTCIVQHSPEPPPAIKWMHNNAEINYDSPRGGVSVITEKGDVTTSFLLIQRARKSDSGKYTCAPSNANPVTVNVHILNGEHPAAMQRGGRLLLGHPIAVAVLAFIPILLDRWLR